MASRIILFSRVVWAHKEVVVGKVERRIMYASEVVYGDFENLHEIHSDDADPTSAPTLAQSPEGHYRHATSGGIPGTPALVTSHLLRMTNTRWRPCTATTNGFGRLRRYAHGERVSPFLPVRLVCAEVNRLRAVEAHEGSRTGHGDAGLVSEHPEVVRPDSQDLRPLGADSERPLNQVWRPRYPGRPIAGPSIMVGVCLETRRFAPRLLRCEVGFGRDGLESPSSCFRTNWK